MRRSCSTARNANGAILVAAIGLGGFGASGKGWKVGGFWIGWKVWNWKFWTIKVVFSVFTGVWRFCHKESRRHGSNLLGLISNFFRSDSNFDFNSNLSTLVSHSDSCILWKYWDDDAPNWEVFIFLYFYF